jgi:hypothetical protein
MHPALSPVFASICDHPVIPLYLTCDSDRQSMFALPMYTIELSPVHNFVCNTPPSNMVLHQLALREILSQKYDSSTLRYFERISAS